jgi:hypothetical protein
MVLAPEEPITTSLAWECQAPARGSFPAPSPPKGKQPGHLLGESRPHHLKALQTGSHLEEREQISGGEQKGTGAAPDLSSRYSPNSYFISPLGKLQDRCTS